MCKRLLIAFLATHVFCGLSMAHDAIQKETEQSVVSPQIAPSKLYEQILAPLDQTRSAMENWSKVEIEALYDARDAAKLECSRLSRISFEGEEQLSAARICALGQNWSIAYEMSTDYIKQGSVKDLAGGYSLQIHSLYALDNPAAMISQLRELLDRVGLNQATDDIFQEAIQELETSKVTLASQIAQMRQPLLLDLISKSNDKTIDPATVMVQALHSLILLKYCKLDAEASSGIRDFDLTLNRSTFKDRINESVAVTRLQYDLVGATLPEVRFQDDNDKRSLGNKKHRTSMYVFYSDSCRQCSAQVPSLTTAFNIRNKAIADGMAISVITSSHLRVSPQLGTRPSNSPEDVRQVKSGSPVRIQAHIDSKGFQMLGGSGYPFFIITDNTNRIRFIGSGPINWLNQHQAIDQLVNRVLYQS
jgi:hypothetical protein